MAAPTTRLLAGKTNKRALPLDAPTNHGARQFDAPSAKPPLPPPVVEKIKREKAPKAKTDPKLIAAARELRDRWLEKMNAEPAVHNAQAKYEVARLVSPLRSQTRLLPRPQAA